MNLEFVGRQWGMIHLPPTKGRKERSVPVPPACITHLRRYLALRGAIKPDNYIFVYSGGRRKGYPVRGEQVYKQFKHYLKKASLPKTRTLHGMRHERVTTWLDDGYNSAEAQFMAGHSSIKTTEGYTHLKGRNLLRKMQEMEGE
jgi:integrase